jgi:hypothetical protein
VERWTESLGDTPASRSVLPGRVLPRKILDIYGQGSEISSGSSHLPGASSKTSPVTSSADLDPCSRISSLSDTGWLEMVASLRSEYSVRRKSAQATAASASSFWPTARTVTGGAESAERKQELGRTESGGGGLQAAAQNWPSPVASEMDRGPAKYKQGGTSLKSKVQGWPTPTAMDSHSSGDTSSTPGSKRHPGTTLTDAAGRKWATPTAPAPHDSEVSVGRERKDRPGYGLELVNQACRWPSPAARDYRTPNTEESEARRFSGDREKSGHQLQNFVAHSPQVRVISVHGGELSPTDPETSSRRRLNPAFVCWLMGWPWWWTNPVPISFARSEMESYLSKLRTLLASLLVERDSPR